MKKAADRIGQIVSMGIAEVPYISVREYPLASLMRSSSIGASV
jgi:hypothetical protein